MSVRHHQHVVSGEGAPLDVLAYGRRLAEAAVGCSDGRLVGAYLHGSAALGGWVSSRSDVDLLIMLDDTATAEHLAAVERLLVANADSCPGTGLECSVVSSAQAIAPSPPWPFLLHVQSTRGEAVRSVTGATSDGDADLLMHYAVVRAAGVPVLGPEPRAVFGPVSRDDVLAYLAGELRWAIEHGSEAYAVLNACRALVYARRGEIVSKLEGGRRALDEGFGPADLVQRALEQQQALSPPSAVTAGAEEFVSLTIRHLPAR